MKKKVAIIGAGPSGLVAAKHLLQHRNTNNFDIVVLEKSNEIGGLWSIDRHVKDGLLSPNMPVNISKYGVGFSDLAWESVDFASNLNSFLKSKNKEEAPLYPRAWQIGRYLQAYAQKYSLNKVIRLGCKVTAVNMVESDDSKSPRWDISWTQESAQSHQTSGDGPVAEDSNSRDHEIFDYMIVASGFFSAPLDLPSSLQVNVPKNSSHVTPIHSSELQTLDDVVPKDWDGHGDILVIGGSMSGAEAASTLAFDLSDRKYSPTAGKSNPSAQPKILHVTSSVFYPMPQVLPSITADGGTEGFIPMNCAFHELSLQPPPELPKFGLASPEESRFINGLAKAVQGSDQSDLGADALVNKSDDEPFVLAVSETYAEWVRSGAVTPLLGRVSELKVEQDDSVDSSENSKRLVAVLQQGSEEVRLNNIVGVVYATGYTPHANLSYLPDEVKVKLGYSEKSHRIPFLLDEQQTHRFDAIGSLGFVGFYEAQFWGCMEMQAIRIAVQWAGALDDTDANSAKSLDNDKISSSTKTQDSSSNTEIPDLERLRDLSIAHHPRVPRLLHNYFMQAEVFASRLGLIRDDSYNYFPLPPATGSEDHPPHTIGGRQGTVIPARYLPPNSSPASRAESATTLKSLSHTLLSCREGTTYVPRVVFRALQGHWTMRRTLTSRLDGSPGGSVEGDAWFHPRRVSRITSSGNRSVEKTEQPASDMDKRLVPGDLDPSDTYNGGGGHAGEYLYSESGTFRPDISGAVGAATATMRTHKRYVYRYAEPEDDLSVWFVKPTDDCSVDYLFHKLRFERPSTSSYAGTANAAESMDGAAGTVGSQNQSNSKGEGKEAKTKGLSPSTWIARGEHLCIDDMYTTRCEFRMEGVRLREFVVVHEVKGPKKDYVSTSVYTRPSE